MDMTNRPSEARRTKRWLIAFFAFNLLSVAASAWFLFHPRHVPMIAPGGFDMNLELWHN